MNFTIEIRITFSYENYMTSHTGSLIASITISCEISYNIFNLTSYRNKCSFSELYNY